MWFLLFDIVLAAAVWSLPVGLSLLLGARFPVAATVWVLLTVLTVPVLLLVQGAGELRGELED